MKEPSKKYVWVGVALLSLTAITVGVNQLNVGIALAVGFALLIAALKGSLVASFFMHLVSERKTVHVLFFSTVLLFIVMLGLILLGQFNVYQGLKHVP